jgi:hypothetical protein
MVKQKILHWKVVGITRLQSALNFFMNGILLLFPNIWTVPPFQRICYIFLCCTIVLYAGLKT